MSGVSSEGIAPIDGRYGSVILLDFNISSADLFLAGIGVLLYASIHPSDPDRSYDQLQHFQTN
jgi:hypothetical protein